MVNIQKVSNQILNDSLYNTLLFEIKEKLFAHEITPLMIEDILKKEPSLLSEYKEINRQSELSSIQIKELVVKAGDTPQAAQRKREINENVQILKNLENFEGDSKNSAYPIWIGSIGVMVVFMAHNIIALFSDLYTTHESAVYISFCIVLWLTYFGYIKVKNNHDAQHKVFAATYTKTKTMIEEGLQNVDFTYQEIYAK
ncbi:MAG: hypothetical protein PHX44_04120 [Sulfurimonas sp.]|uniref:hypothetical protein n=1 Tax=Sulfurimonas sp. TaxID=2022749 RepID=UPI002627ABBB|nr:hypothetical protein [Sulfurimonas sp.]MDD2652218.1 hypothetical protein [Sulfurimonas sp.]MDD3450500.1 hypothetical protein [Sulfurimonas sp.]